MLAQISRETMCLTIKRLSQIRTPSLCSGPLLLRCMNTLGAAKIRSQLAGMKYLSISISFKKSGRHYCRTLIMNLCFQSGSFPSKLKTALVKPIFKNKGAIDILKNYRPVSLLSNVSKIFQKLIYERLIRFFDECAVITDCKYGF